MFMRVIRRSQCSAIVSSQFIKSVSKKYSFSNAKNHKREQHVAFRTYVSTVPEVNKSSKLEDDNQRKVRHDLFYYSNYISTDPQFSEFFFRKELISENANNSSQLFTTLRELSKKSETVTEDLECLLSYLRAELPNLSFHELLEAMDLTFKLYEKKHEHVWALIRNHFDRELLSRRTSLSVSEILMVINLFSSFGIAKKFNFLHKVMYKLVFKVDKLNHPAFVLFCYNLRMLRYIILDKFKFEFLNYINNRIPSLNQTELGLLSDAFTAVDLKFKPPLFQTVMMKVLNELENMDTVVITSICRNLAKNSHMDNMQLLIDFQEKLTSLVPKFKNQDLRALVSSGMSVRYLNMALYDEVMKRVKSDIADFHLQQIAWFALLNATFNIYDKEFLDMAVNEFERRDDYLQNYVAYLKFLGELIHFQIYPENLLKKVLTNDIFTIVMKDNSGRVSWALLKWSLEIEKPEFKLPEVDEKLHAKLLKYMKFVKFPNSPEFLYNKKLYSMLGDIYGKDFICSRRIQLQNPNFCIMRFDKNLKPQEIPKEFRESRDDFKMTPPYDDHIWVCIIPLHRKLYADSDSKIINYKTKTYVRHISILGYKYIYLTKTEWSGDTNDGPSDLAYLESLINKKLQELTGEIQKTESET